MAKNILVITELIQNTFRKPSFEAISEARRQADINGGRVIALVIGAGIDALTSIPAQYGADEVVVVNDEKLNTYSSDYYPAIVKQVCESQNADLILMPATDQGKDLAPRVAAKLEAGLAEDCLKINVDGDLLEVERPMYAGKIIAKVAIKSKIKIATLRPNVFAASEPDPSKTAPVQEIPMPDVPSRTTVKSFQAAEGAKVDIAEANIIVTGGRGMKEATNFNIIEELAEVLGGVVGATRAAVDAGWRPHAEQVGQTGKTVSPNLYLIIGASGSIQHWAGMSGARCIVAVNKNPEAPIIEKADYSIVGDLFEVVPVLTQELKKIRG